MMMMSYYKYLMLVFKQCIFYNKYYKSYFNPTMILVRTFLDEL